MGAVMVGVHTFVEDEDYLGKGDDDVIGLQIGGLFAFSRKLYGFQVSGLGNDAGNIPCGFQVAGLFNYVEHDMGFGLQLAGLWNRYESGAGLQLAIANEVDKDFAGIQLGLCNWGESAPSKGRIAFVEPQTIVNFVHHVCHQQGVEDMRGLQVGLVNKAADMYGIQCGILWNNAKCARGLQVGLVNIADSLTGVQLGVANIIKDSPVLFLPLFNAHF